MAIEIHTPPLYTDIPVWEAAVFLAGPIQGAPDWQSEAVDIFADRIPPAKKVHLANPRRDTFNDGPFDKDEQLTWEKSHLRHARDYGCLLFWLAAESEDAPAPNKPGRAYAQTTRIEFGRAVGWRDYAATMAISLGIDPAYEGSVDYYRHTAAEVGIPVYDSLELVVADVTVKLENLDYGTI